MIVRRELSTGLENSQLIIKGTYMILICETKANFTQKLSVFLQEEIQKKIFEDLFRFASRHASAYSCIIKIIMLYQ